MSKNIIYTGGYNNYNDFSYNIFTNMSLNNIEKN
jgi:hypothetical protein